MNQEPKNCVGNVTDGAENMQDQYNGFSAKLSKVATKQIHMNLVIGDITLKVLQSINLFGILNGWAVFI